MRQFASGVRGTVTPGDKPPALASSPFSVAPCGGCSQTGRRRPHTVARVEAMVGTSAKMRSERSTGIQTGRLRGALAGGDVRGVDAYTDRRHEGADDQGGRADDDEC